MARQPGRGEPGRRLPHLRRLRPRVLHAGGRGAAGCKPNPQTIGQPPSTYWNASGTADFEISKKVVARFFGDYQLREVRDYFFSGATQLASTVYDSQRDLTRYTLSPEVDFLLSPRTSFNATYTYGKYLRDETRVFVSDGRVVPQPVAGVEPGGEAHRPPRLAGLRPRAPAAGRLRVPQREAPARQPERHPTPARDINVLWGQQELNVTSRLKLTAGLRYDDYSDFGDEWSPKAEAVFTLAPEHRLRGSYGHGFRPPYFGELYLSTPPFFVGNPDLVPEVSDGFTAGYTFAGKKAQVSVDGYYTKVKNGIIFFQLTPSQFTYRNIDRYNSKGVNVAASVSLPWGFTPSVAYAYNKREDPEGAEVGGYPNHSGFLKLLWANPRLGLRANLRGQINGKVPPGVDGTYQPAYDLWSAQVSKRFASLGAYGVNVYAQVDNLFDESDIFLANADGTPVQGQFQVWLAPRTFQVGVIAGHGLGAVGRALGRGQPADPGPLRALVRPLDAVAGPAPAAARPHDATGGRHRAARAREAQPEDQLVADREVARLERQARPPSERFSASPAAVARASVSAETRTGWVGARRSHRRCCSAPSRHRHASSRTTQYPTTGRRRCHSTTVLQPRRSRSR